MKKCEAMKEAAKLLKDEASELAVVDTRPEWKDLPPRAKAAIRGTDKPLISRRRHSRPVKSRAVLAGCTAARHYRPHG